MARITYQRVYNITLNYLKAKRHIWLNMKIVPASTHTSMLQCFLVKIVDAFMFVRVANLK